MSSSTAIAERRGKRLDQVLTAAWDIAAEQGLGAVSLREVARRVGIKQPSLYSYVSSKLDLYDAMYRQAYEQLLSELDQETPTGTAREQLLRLSRVVLDFVVADPPRQQLLFQRTIPGFEPSSESLTVAMRLVDRAQSLLAAHGRGAEADLDVYTALIAGLGSQQIANDPGGDRYTRHLESLLDTYLGHFPSEDDTRGRTDSTPGESR